MNRNILHASYDPEEFRRQGHRLVDRLAGYLKECIDAHDMPVMPWKEPEEQYEYWKHHLDKDDDPDAEEFFKQILQQSIHLHHPHYLGHQVVPPLPMAALTELLEAFTNNSMAVYEVGPASTAIEKAVVQWMISHLSYPGTANGLLTSGGSLGNLTALLAAKENYFNQSKKVDGKPSIMFSPESHYSIERAARIMGLDAEQMIHLPVKDNRIDVERLPTVLEKVKSQGKAVVALCANACSTATGTYDRLEELVAFCSENRIWLHVDAAHGGPAIFSEKYKHLLNGIEKANSIVIDFHKMMMIPALTTAVLFKDGRTSYRTFSQKADYLLKQENKWYDIAKRSIECTKKPMALKVYLMIRMYGTELFESYIDQTYDLAKDFAALIKSEDDFELAASPESNIVCFRLIRAGLPDYQLDKLNSKVRDQLIKSGKFYIVQTTLNNKLFLRTTLMNPFTDIEILKNLLTEIQRLAMKF
ncbi:MAG: aminotransferase class I/II-fold pyridoxal phosphate-dependent enzyme [Bacteroidales bacterium]|nr:aminotransferase class I/II-fold pyridoxal phosphate-dependent enzyme [Bacteroidales bacterium]MCF8346223.1 aminotransferase class I/II-fold pyridoxal phosphate-dependent enzyme [Bacteroidales bacterium]MCF8376628.1 aminotransferase class I/II-fold pyridoxal phosphate-dependent enzyme [Bacteroidales bacterium]MCF8400650.1 aminotransferase class I/II-fold pyridoxal phosphate-dependent enzyme [Bacteroidales bacterium]